MFETIKRKPFKERLKDTGYLIKHSFVIIGKDKDIKTPTIHMILLALIISLAIYASIILLILGFTQTGLGILLATLFILVPFKFFYNVRQKADQSWIVYNTVCGKDISYHDAHQHTKTQKSRLRVIALIDFLMGYAKRQRNNKKSMLSFLINLFLSFLLEVWDLLSHYMIPAVVIEQKPLREIVPTIKSLRTNVPATLTGVFGIDFVGTVVGTLFGGIFLLFLIISIGVGYLIAQFTQATVIHLGSFQFSWVPVVIMLLIVSIISTIYKNIVASIKVIYFTIFYTSIMRPMQISPQIRSELTHYLRMEPSDFKPVEQPRPQDKYIQQLSQYISQYQSSGYSEQQIVQFLKSHGYPSKDITLALKKR